MAKPSKTNIHPPSKTEVWVPPLTEWDMDADAFLGQVSAEFYQTKDDPNFFDLLGQINQPASSPVIDFNDYDYVFFGVNGGRDETVHGHKNKGGVIVTGNGKDKIYGGDEGDLIYAGNGKDYVHGGDGNDIIFGENGADELWGGKDSGAFSVTEGEGEGYYVLKEGLEDFFGDDPHGLSLDANPHPSGHTIVRKEGVHIKVDGDGVPTELDGDGNPIVHVVYSILPHATDDYTVAYYRGNNPDGPGEPDPDSFIVHLEAGKLYFFSFINTDGPDSGPQIRVLVFEGAVDDLPSGAPGQWDDEPIATSQATPIPDWQDYFDHVEGGGDPVVSFEAGDQLIGGNGPDTFTYAKGDGVDLIKDFELADPDSGFAGDTLVLSGFDGANDANGDTIFGLNDLKAAVDIDGNLIVGFDDGVGGWLADSAIKFEGYGLGDFDILKTQIEIQS